MEVLRKLNLLFQIGENMKHDKIYFMNKGIEFNITNIIKKFLINSINETFNIYVPVFYTIDKINFNFI